MSNPEDVVLSMAAHARFVLDNIVVLFRVRGWDDIITFARTLLKAVPQARILQALFGNNELCGELWRARRSRRDRRARFPAPHTRVMTDAAAPTSDSGPLTSSASPAARFATFSSRVQGVSADAYRDYARRYGHPGASHGVMTLAHPHSAQAVTGALVALKAKCDAAEAERDEWRSKCADAERARDAATAASERATRDATEATTRATTARDAAESRAVADAEDARRVAADATARAERAEADLARVKSSHEARLAATLAGDPARLATELAAARAEHATRVRELQAAWTARCEEAKRRAAADTNARADAAEANRSRARRVRELESAVAHLSNLNATLAQTAVDARAASVNAAARRRRPRVRVAPRRGRSVAGSDAGSDAGSVRSRSGSRRGRAARAASRETVRAAAACPATNNPASASAAPALAAASAVGKMRARAKKSERDARVVEPPRSARGSTSKPPVAPETRRSLASRAARALGASDSYVSSHPTADEFEYSAATGRRERRGVGATRGDETFASASATKPRAKTKPGRQPFRNAPKNVPAAGVSVSVSRTAGGYEYAPNRKYGDGSAKENSLRALKASRARRGWRRLRSVDRRRDRDEDRKNEHPTTKTTTSPAGNPSPGQALRPPRAPRERARSSTGAVATTRRHLDAALREDFDRLRSEYEDVLARATSGGGERISEEKLRSVVARLQEKSAQIAGVAFLR